MINEHKKNRRAVKYNIKPRNFVAKNATTSGAGEHKDKSKELPRKAKHKDKEMSIAEGEGNFAKAIDNLNGWYQVDSRNPDIEVFEFDDREGGFYAQGTVYHNTKTGRVKIEFEDKDGYHGGDIDDTFNSIGDAMDVLRRITTEIHPNTGKAQNFDRLGGRSVAGQDDVYKTDRAGKKGTLTKSRMDTMKMTSPYRKTGPKGVLPEGLLKEDIMGAPRPEDNHEATMALSELYRNAKYGMALLKIIEPNDAIDGWVQANLTSAADMLDKVGHYLDYKNIHGRKPEVAMEEDDNVDDADPGDTDGSMAREHLEMIVEYSIRLMEMIKPGDNLASWVSMKLTKASEAISSAKHFIEYRNFEKHAGDVFENKLIRMLAVELSESDIRKEKKQGVAEAVTSMPFGRVTAPDPSPEQQAAYTAQQQQQARFDPRWRLRPEGKEWLTMARQELEAAAQESDHDFKEVGIALSHDQVEKFGKNKDTFKYGNRFHADLTTDILKLMNQINPPQGGYSADDEAIADLSDKYAVSSEKEKQQLYKMTAKNNNMTTSEAKEYIEDCIAQNTMIDPEQWKEWNRDEEETELGEKITAVSGTAPAGYNNKPTTTSSKKPVGGGVTGGTVYTGGSSQRPASSLDRVRSKMGKGVAEDAHGSEHFMDIVDATNGDVRGIMQELRSSGLHSEIIKFCQWAREQGIADIYDAMKLAKRVGLENDDENEFAYEGYLHIKELLGGVAEAGYGRNRGYTQGFASPNAPSLGGNRYDSDGNQLGGGHDEYPSGGNQPMNFDRPQIVAWWFFDVPPDREEEARAYDIKKTKSGKYGMPQYDKSGRSFALRMNTATQKFGKPKKWVPKQ